MKFIAQIKKISIATIIISIAAGVLLIVFPEQCMQYISLAFGIALAAVGAVGIINYFREKASGFTLVMGIITALVGLFICFKYDAVLKFIVALMGIFFIIAGITNFFTGIKVILSSGVFGWFTLVLSVATIAFGIIAVTKSMELTVTIVRFIGISLFVYAALDIVSYFQVRKIVKNVNRKVESVNDINIEGNIAE